MISTHSSIQIAVDDLYLDSLLPLWKTFDLNMSKLFSLLSTGIGNEGRFAMSPKFEIRRQKTEAGGRVSFADSLY